MFGMGTGVASSPSLPDIMERVKGIEPTPKVLETSILPLNYAPKMVEGDGFEPPNPKERIYSPPRLATSLPLQGMVPAKGVEASTY